MPLRVEGRARTLRGPHPARRPARRSSLRRSLVLRATRGHLSGQDAVAVGAVGQLAAGALQGAGHGNFNLMDVRLGLLTDEASAPFLSLPRSTTLW